MGRSKGGGGGRTRGRRASRNSGPTQQSRQSARRAISQSQDRVAELNNIRSDFSRQINDYVRDIEQRGIVGPAATRGMNRILDRETRAVEAVQRKRINQSINLQGLDRERAATVRQALRQSAPNNVVLAVAQEEQLQRTIRNLMLD